MCHWLAFKDVSFTKVSMLCITVHYFAIRRALGSISWENEWTPRLALSTIEMVDLKTYIVVAGLPSTGVRCLLVFVVDMPEMLVSSCHLPFLQILEPKIVIIIDLFGNPNPISSNDLTQILDSIILSLYLFTSLIISNGWEYFAICECCHFPSNLTQHYFVKKIHNMLLHHCRFCPVCCCC